MADPLLTLSYAAPPNARVPRVKFVVACWTSCLGIALGGICNFATVVGAPCLLQTDRPTRDWRQNAENTIRAFACGALFLGPGWWYLRVSRRGLQEAAESALAMTLLLSVRGAMPEATALHEAPLERQTKGRTYLRADRPSQTCAGVPFDVFVEVDPWVTLWCVIVRSRGRLLLDVPGIAVGQFISLTLPTNE